MNAAMAATDSVFLRTSGSGFGTCRLSRMTVSQQTVLIIAEIMHLDFVLTSKEGKLSRRFMPVLRNSDPQPVQGSVKTG